MAALPTISDQFNDDNYGGRPVRPVDYGRGRVKDRTRNVVLENRKTVGIVPNNPRQKAADDPRYRQTTDEAFNAEYAKKGLQPLGLLNKPDHKPAEGRTDAPLARRANQGQDKAVPRAVKTRGMGGKAGLSVSKDKIVATALTRVIMSVGFSVWLFFQVPMAILNIVFFGIAYLLYGVADTAIGSVLKKAFDFVTKPLEWIGLDFLTSLADPAIPYMVTLIIIMAFAIIQFLIICMLYIGASLAPITGTTGGGLKLGLVVLYFVGYFIPILNLFPWFLPWVWTVKKYPK